MSFDTVVDLLTDISHSPGYVSVSQAVDVRVDSGSADSHRDARVFDLAWRVDGSARAQSLSI